MDRKEQLSIEQQEVLEVGEEEQEQMILNLYALNLCVYGQLTHSVSSMELAGGSHGALSAPTFNRVKYD